MKLPFYIYLSIYFFLLIFRTQVRLAKKQKSLCKWRGSFLYFLLIPFPKDSWRNLLLIDLYNHIQLLTSWLQPKSCCSSKKHNFFSTFLIFYSIVKYFKNIQGKLTLCMIFYSTNFLFYDNNVITLVGKCFHIIKNHLPKKCLKSVCWYTLVWHPSK